ncbi:MAG: hypothetical protein ACT4OH_03535 [Methylophilaceae bacterium]
MESKTWIDYAVAIGSISTPLLVLLLTAVGWKARTSIERKIELENKLRDDRIKIYNQILEPFIIILMNDDAWKKDKKYKNMDKIAYATSIMLSLEYREASFRLALMAPDSLVKSYNELMQSFFNSDEDSGKDKLKGYKTLVKLLGTFLIEIRKSMGNVSTKLDHWDMCEFWMTDARKLKNGTLIVEP